MRAKATFLFFLLLYPFIHFTQTDSVEFTPGMQMADGLYLTYADFRSNRSIGKDAINSKLDKEQLEFITKTLANEKFSATVDGTQINIVSKDVWAYFQNNTFYVNYKGDFYRVPVFGSISYLVAYVTVISPAFYDPRYAMTSPTTTSKELKEFLINFYDGEMTEFNLKAAEELLSRDSRLYEEYMKLSNRKKKDAVYQYIRRYNSAHPIYFLK